MSSWWFDCTEPSQTTSLQGIQGVQGAICTEVKAHRTSFTKYILTERGRYIDFKYMSSGWFDWTEPSLTTSLQGIEVLYVLRFKHIEPHRTLSNCFLTEIARYRDFFYMSSGWFDWTEPSLTTSLQGIEVLYVLVR